jgi:hypothetical protein
VFKGTIAQACTLWQGRFRIPSKKERNCTHFKGWEGRNAQETASGFSGFSKLSGFEDFYRKSSCGAEVSMVF